MKPALLSLLRCNRCAAEFSLSSTVADGTEVMEGALACSGCGAVFPIVRGVPRFVDQSISADKHATANAFAYEWTHYSELTEADEREFLAWLAPTQPKDFKDQVVLDAGCGKGRHAFLAASYGAREVVAVDLSGAVEAAFANTRSLPNVHVVQADLLNLPFQAPFTLAYSIGVLHHLPDPKAGFLAVASHIRPGGRICTWVYGREGNEWIVRFVDPIRKGITSRVPRITRVLSFPPAVILYAALKLFYLPARTRPWLKRILPYSDYLCAISGYTFAENFWNVFDQLVAPTAFYHREEEIVDWYRTAPVEQVLIGRHNGNSWRGTAVIAAQAAEKHLTAQA
jgi:SAM-dependent methyltransferase